MYVAKKVLQNHIFSLVSSFVFSFGSSYYNYFAGVNVMNIKATTGNGWIYLENLNNKKANKDGFWITYCPENVYKQNKEIVNQIKNIIFQEGLIGGQVEAFFYDTYIIYTSANRNEIYKVRERLIKERICAI